MGGDPEANELAAGYLSDVQFYARAIDLAEIQQAMEGIPEGEATTPYPENGSIEVPIDVMMSWGPGEFAHTHNVYLGTDFDDVNDATPADTDLLRSERQSELSYAPDDLDWGTTYYWRIDEVNAPPTESTVFKGNTWSFTTELYSYAIEPQNITATATSQYGPDMGPENTINDSGLTSVSHPIDTRDDVHSYVSSDMWLSSEEDAGPVSIQYDLDKPYMLDQVIVWNFNAVSYLTLLGLKDVTVEYTADGETWMPFNATEFGQATGKSDYLANTSLVFDSLVAKGVRFTVV